MTRASAVTLSSAILLMTGGCATVVVPCVPPCHTPMASRLTELQLPRGAKLVVELVDGQVVRGTVQDLRPAELEVVVDTPGDRPSRRIIAESHIRTIAHVVGMSKRK